MCKNYSVKRKTKMDKKMKIVTGLLASFFCIGIICIILLGEVSDDQRCRLAFET